MQQIYNQNPMFSGIKIKKILPKNLKKIFLVFMLEKTIG
jgi:hypothetical protein